MGKALLHNRQFASALQRAAASFALAAALAAAAAAPGCSRSPNSLTREEQHLVQQLVAQARATLAAAREDSAGDRGGSGADSTAIPPAPGGAADPDQFPAWRDSATLRQQLEGPWAGLWSDPERGRRVLQAVHDSLQALRPVLFPPPPRPVPPAAPDSTARPRVP